MKIAGMRALFGSTDSSLINFKFLFMNQDLKNIRIVSSKKMIFKTIFDIFVVNNWWINPHHQSDNFISRCYLVSVFRLVRGIFHP